MSRTSVDAKSGKVPPSTDEPGKGKTQAVFTTAIGMSESELLALEARVRAVGGASESPFSSRSPLAQASTSISHASSPVPQTHSPVSLTHSPPAPVQTLLHSCVPRSKLSMKLIMIRVICCICVDKLNNMLMTKSIDQIRPSRFVMSRFCMMSMGKIESQFQPNKTRSFEDYEQVRQHIQVADHDSRTCGGVVSWERKHVQAKRQRQQWGG